MHGIRSLHSNTKEKQHIKLTYIYLWVYVQHSVGPSKREMTSWYILDVTNLDYAKTPTDNKLLGSGVVPVIQDKGLYRLWELN
jgi:hypothetical protein